MAVVRWRQQRAWAMEAALVDNGMDLMGRQLEETYVSTDEALRAALAFKELADRSPSLPILLRYEARLKGQRDYDTGIHCAKREGIAIGREEGIEEGLDRGDAIGCVRTLQEILLLSVTPRSELREMPLSELETLLAELRAKHFNRGTAP